MQRPWPPDAIRSVDLDLEHDDESISSSTPLPTHPLLYIAGKYILSGNAVRTLSHHARCSSFMLVYDIDTGNRNVRILDGTARPGRHTLYLPYYPVLIHHRRPTPLPLPLPLPPSLLPPRHRVRLGGQAGLSKANLPVGGQLPIVGVDAGPLHPAPIAG